MTAALAEVLIPPNQSGHSSPGMGEMSSPSVLWDVMLLLMAEP